MAKRYETLTKGWFGIYDTEKIVAFAAQSGHVFTKTNLEYIRLTNEKSGDREHEGVRDKGDFQPTELPSPPADPALFRQWHNRDVG